MTFFVDVIKFVFVTPGSMIMVLIPNGESSYLIDSLNPSIANFELIYAGETGKPIFPATELTFTMIPDFCFLITGMTACKTLTTPKKFVSNCAFSSSIEISSRQPNSP